MDRTAAGCPERPVAAEARGELPIACVTDGCAGPGLACGEAAPGVVPAPGAGGPDLMPEGAA